MANFSTASLAFSEQSYGDDSGLAVYVAKAIDPSLCWDDITWLKANTHLPVILKGILNGTHTHIHTHSKVIVFVFLETQPKYIVHHEGGKKAFERLQYVSNNCY